MAGAKGDDDVAAQSTLVSRIFAQAELQLSPELRPPPFDAPNPNTHFIDFLRHWSERSPRKLVLLLDEIDSLVGQSLIVIHRAHVDKAKERLILARATHLDSLVSKLTEPRVRRVIEPLLAGELPPVDEVFNDDISYVIDLGLVKSQPLRMANPILARSFGPTDASISTCSSASSHRSGSNRAIR